MSGFSPQTLIQFLTGHIRMGNSTFVLHSQPRRSRGLMSCVSVHPLGDERAVRQTLATPRGPAERMEVLMTDVPVTTHPLTLQRVLSRNWIRTGLLSISLYAASAPEAARAQDSTLATQVMVIASLHNNHLIYPHYGPQHVRALLEKFQPDAVAVENDRGWHEQQRLTFPFMVEVYVAMDWARDHGAPTYGIDWSEQTFARDEPDSSGVSELAEKILAGDPETRTAIARGARSFTRQVASIIYSDIRQDVLYMHTSDIKQGMKAMESWPARVRDGLDERDQHIADNVLAVVKEEHVQKLAIVIGGGHEPGLRRRLSNEPGVEWVDTEELLPLTALEEEATLSDVYWLLSRHLDGLDMEWDRQKLDWRLTYDLLQKALSEAPDSAVTRYFQARWDWWMENDRAAETGLQELLELDPDFAFPFPINSIWQWPPLSSVRAKAMFSLANLYDYRGERDKALALYGELVQLGESLNVYGHQRAFLSYDVHGYIESFLEEPYCRCEEEFIRPKGYFYESTLEDLKTVPWVW